MIVGNLLKSVVVPAATATLELTQWHWMLVGVVLGTAVNNLSEDRKERQTYERPHYERIPYERPHYERTYYEGPRRRNWEDA